MNIPSHNYPHRFINMPALENINYTQDNNSAMCPYNEHCFEYKRESIDGIRRCPYYHDINPEDVIITHMCRHGDTCFMNKKGMCVFNH